MEAKKVKKDLLYHMEKVVEELKDSQLSKEFFKKAAPHIRYVSKKLDMTQEQSVLMSLFIDKSDHNPIYISELTEYMKCRTVRIIRYMPDIDELERRGLVRCSRSERRLSYRVPIEVINAFKNNENYIPRNIHDLTCSDLFAELQDIFMERDDCELTYEGTVEKVKYLLECNRHLVFTSRILSYRFDDDDLCLLILFCHLFVNNTDDRIRFHDIEFLYKDTRRFSRLKCRLQCEEHILQEEKLIEFSGEDGFKDRDTFKMTSEAKSFLFPELKIPSMDNDKKRGDMIRHEDISPKQLFYDKSITAQIQELGGLLDEKHYKDVCSRLKANGFRSGFTCLFYGAPGTGKTETVLQLARQTGRDIVQVNVSEIKSMWVGESEKNIKNLFDLYRQKVKEMAIAPILLFNEADAIIGKRQEGAERAVDKMENSIQNIILQEMESLEGILIATTNLAQNMDKAFERRFLYKIKFTKPTLEARTAIWKSMIPSLSEEIAHALANKYDFSGGQIENIARHYAIDNILHGAKAGELTTLTEHCDNERLEKDGIKRRIGFV
ncbi:ATP-binding protein [Prevotella histicola]|jgi:AAA ATPase|uniref:ATP-binding protein n=1 Tax=Prevotella histicola TaxID=470565 RepID=UPI00288057C3|nr:ATP-binding protein [Prevotella histicola]